MDTQLARACLISLDHLLTAVQNVQLTRSAKRLRVVYDRSASIPALEFADKVQNVELSTTHQSVVAVKDLKAIHLQDVLLSKVSNIIYFKL